jgi:hypothetical protein
MLKMAKIPYGAFPASKSAAKSRNHGLNRAQYFGRQTLIQATPARPFVM